MTYDNWKTRSPDEGRYDPGTDDFCLIHAAIAKAEGR